VLICSVFTQTWSADIELNQENQRLANNNNDPHKEASHTFVPPLNRKKKLTFAPISCTSPRREESKGFSAEEILQLNTYTGLSGQAHGYFGKKQYKNAISHYHMCAIARDTSQLDFTEQNRLIATCYKKIGLCHYAQQSYREAYDYFKRRLLTLEKAGLSIKPEYYIYIMRSHNKSNNYVTSVQYVDSWLTALAQEGKSPSKEGYGDLIEMYTKAGNPQEAERFAKILRDI